MVQWHAVLFTLFPEMFPGPLGHSVTGRGLKEESWALTTVNIRDFAEDAHRTVDDTPYGGGAGMVMRPDILAKAIESQAVDNIIYLSPRGKRLTQDKTHELLALKTLGILCGRYEGVDQRLLDHYNIEEISIGDYILSGGEIAAYVLIDACVRQISGVLSNRESCSEESFGSGAYARLLEYPHYTRPQNWNDQPVPEVLQSGNHAEINSWRLKQAEELTRQRRPDLWQQYQQIKKTNA